MIVSLTEEYARHVVDNMVDDDVAEILETHWLDSTEGFAEICMGSPGPSWAALANDGEPVAIGGMSLFYPNVATLWLVGTKRLPECAVAISRMAKKSISGALRDGQLHRVHAFADSRHKRTHPWLRAIGLKDETPLPKWGKTGADFIMFSATR